MKRLLWARVLRTMFASKVKTVTNARAKRPALEHLEQRLAPAAFIWSGGGGTANRNWSSGLNWVGGVAPTASANPVDDLVFPLSAGNRTAVNDLLVSGAPAAFKSVTIAGSDYTLQPLAPANGIRLGDPSITSGSNVIVNAGAANNTISLDVQFAGAGGSRQFVTVGFGGDVTVSGKVTGNTGVELTKGGIGTLVLTGDNSGFTGPITLDNNGGVVTIGHRLALGTTGQPTRVGTNATLKVRNVDGTIQEPLILNGPGNDNLGALQNLAGNNTWSGTVRLDSDVTVGGDAGSLEILGRISDTGAGRSLAKEGLGNIIFSAENTYRGLTTINNGVLTIRHGKALGADITTAPNSGTVVNHTITQKGTLAIEDTVGTGLLIRDEVLTISGQGFVRGAGTPGIDPDQGAVNNLLGNNEWAGTVFVGGLLPQFTRTAWIGAQNAGTTQTTLLFSGEILDQAGQAGLFTLQKVGPGKVIFSNDNDYAGATIIREGTLTIRDSGALGLGGGTTVRDRATLELEVDTGFDPHGRPLGNDSATGVQNRLDITEQLTLNGVGVLDTGALKSLSGINRVLSMVNLGVQASIAAIGVDPDPDPSSDDSYFTDDYSLTLTGGLADSAATNPTVLQKVLTGQLILPTANTGYHGITIVSAGWITAMNSASLGGYFTAGGTEPGFPLGQGPTALGQTVQPYVKVEDGGSLHLRTSGPAGSISIAQNVILAGNGITHPFALISGKGALMNVQGNNTLTGDVHLSGQAGIGVERTNLANPASVSELTLTGSMDDTKTFQIDPDRAARIGTTGEENSHIIDTGAVSGSLTVTYDFRDIVFPFTSINDELRVYSPPRAFGGSLIFSTGSVPGPGVFTVPYTTAAAGMPGSELVEIVVNEGGGVSPAQGNSWFYQATFTPTLAVPQGGITKFGSKRLNLQGDGTYTGAVNVNAGVLRIQSDTALGSSAAGTTVEAGAALELDRTLATNTGGLVNGVQVWNEQLTLNGPGNSTNGALIHPLTALSKDNLWRGGVSLMTAATIDVKANARLNVLRTVDDTGASAPADLTKVGTGELALAGTNTYRGVTRINEGIVTVENGLALGAGGPSSGTEVVSTATLQLQGDITVPGESLKIIGSGIGALPTLPVRWFSTGPAAVTNGETPGNNTVSGGRVTSVAVDPSDPNTIYLTAGTGGAWKTKDNGRTWLPLVDTVLGPNGLPLNVQTMYMGYVTVAPQDPRIIYVGTGEARSTMRPNAGASDQYGGVGILRSTDGGKTWSVMQGKTNEFVGKAITKIVVDPGATFRGVASQNVIYVAVANAAVAPPGTPAGNNGLWRYNGTGNNWTILTNAADNPSPFRLSQNPPELRPGPDDDLAHHFHDTDDYTDVVVSINRANQAHRVIAFAIGTPDGGRATVSGTTTTFNNGIFVSVFSGDTVDFQNFKWRLAGFVTTQTIDDTGGGALPYPVPGVIKLGISTVNPGLKADLTPGDYRLYASVAWPENGNDTTYNDFGLPNPYPFLPRPNGNNDGREGTMRSVQRMELNWDPNNGRYNVGTWGNTPAQPPSYLSTPKESPHGTFEVGYGNYSQALIVQPGRTNPESNNEAIDVLFLGGMGFPYAEGVLMSVDGGSTWTDITTGTDGKGPGAFIHNFGYDTGLLGGQPRVIVAGDTGVYRLDNSTPGAIRWVGLNGDLSLGQMNGLDVHPTSVDIAYGGLQNNGTVLFDGTTATWRQTDRGSGGQIYVDPKFPNILYHVKSIPVGPGTASSGSMLRKSTDGGNTWVDILRLDAGTAQWSPLLFTTGGVSRPTRDTEVKYEARSPFLVDPINTSRLLAGERTDVAITVGQPFGPRLRESVNGGASWIDLRVPTTATGGLNLLSINAIQAAQFQGLFAADPGFPQVVDQGANTYVPDTIYALAIYQDGAGNRVPRLAVTKNRGVTWQVRPFGTNLDQVQDIFVNPSNRDEIYAVRNVAAGGQQILKSTDAGQTWDDAITGNLPADLPVWTILVDPRNDNVYAGTDRGVWKMTKVGAAFTWAPLGEGMPNVQVRFLNLNQGLNTLTAGTYGRGMFQLFLADYEVNGGVLRSVAGSAVWTGPVQLTGNTTIGAGGRQTLQGGRSVAQLTILGEISDATPGANYTLRKNGQGDVILGGANTYGGVTIVEEGVLVVTNPLALGSSGNPTIVDNAQFPDTALELQSDLLDEPLTLRGNGILFNGHFTGVLRNVSNFNRYTGVATLLGDVTIGVDSGSSLTIAGNGTLVDQGGLTKVTKELTGLLVFQTANNYGGTTTVNQGILNVQHPLALGRTTGGNVVLDGAQLQIERNAVSLVDTVIVGEALRLSGTGIFDTGALLNTVGDNTWRGPVTLARDPNFSPPTVAPTEAGIGVDRGQDELTIDGPVGDINDPLLPVGLRKVRPGRLTMTRANTYPGLTDIVAGVVRILNGAGLGTVDAGTLVHAGAALQVDNNINTLPEALFLNGTGVGETGALRSVGGSNTYNGPVTLETNTSIGVDAGSLLEVTGVVADSPPPITQTAASLDKVGTGKLLFSGANTYGGDTLVREGILDISHATGLGLDASEVQEITLFGSAGNFRITFDGVQTPAPGISLVSPTLAADVQAALNALSTIGGVGGSVTVVRTGGILRVTFGGSLVGRDLPQMTVSGTGGTFGTVATIRHGTGATVVQSGATLQVQGGINVSTETLTLNGTGFDGIGALDNLFSNNTWSRPILLASDVAIGSEAGTLSINQPIGDAGSNFGVTKVGPGTLDYQAANSYTGPTLVNDGTLLLNNAGGPSLAGTSLTIGDGTGAADSAKVVWQFPDQIPNSSTVFVQGDGLLDLNGKSQTVSTLRVVDGDARTGTGGLLTVGALDMTGGAVTLQTAASRLVLAGNVVATSSATETATVTGPGQVSLDGTTRTVNVANGPMGTDLHVSSVISSTGAAGLTKNGAGRLELDAVNTYTGDTTINSGDVQVDGTIGNVKLAGGTLSGKGTAGTVSGFSPAVGTVSPGDNGLPNPNGILTTGAQEWGPNTTFFVNLDDADANPATQPVPGVEHDQLVVNGNVTLGGATLDGLIGAGLRVGDTYTILRTIGGTITGRFAEPQGPGIVHINGRKFGVNYSDPTRVVLTSLVTDVVITATSSDNPSAYGQALTFTATVVQLIGGGPVQTAATVTFTIDAGTPNEISRTKFLDANGQATFDPTEVFPNTPLGVGTHTVTMRFNGNSEYAAANTTLNPAQTVNQAATTTTVTTTPSPVFGQPIIVTATVTPDVAVVPTAALPTGTANFTVVNLTTGASTQMTATVTNGVAQVTLTGLGVNDYSVSVEYLGDTNYVASTSDDQEFSIAKANTDGTVIATPPQTGFGQLATFTVTVAAVAPGAGTPTGQVVFWDGPAGTGTMLGSRTLSNGTASLSIATLALGLHDVTVVYAGDANFNGDTSVLSGYQVGGAATTTMVSATPLTPVVGQAVTVTAMVRRNIGAGVPTGSVTFTYPGGTQTVPLNAQGKASAIIPGLPVGPQTITADYVATGDYANSSGQINLTVNPAATTTTVSAVNSPSAVGQQVTFVASVRANAPGTGVPATGDVVFVLDGVPQAPVAVDANGRATITATFNSLGVHTVTARYLGSTNFNASPISTTLNHRVVAFATTVALVKSPAATVYGQAVGVSATVTSIGGPTPTGRVQFLVDGLAFGAPVAVNALGKASVLIRAMGAGDHVVTAHYLGSATQAGSQAELPHSVGKADTRTVLTATPRPSQFGQTVTFFATMTPVAPGGLIPQGTVTFIIDGVAQNPVPVNAVGRAAITRSNLPIGTHTVQAVFNGNVNYNGSESVVLNQQVTPPPPPNRLAAGLTPNPVAVLTPFTLTVFAKDVFNNISTTYNAPVAVTLLSGPAGGVLTGNLSMNFTNGVAAFTNLLVTVGGRYRLRITSGNLFSDLEFVTIGRQT